MLTFALISSLGWSFALPGGNEHNLRSAVLPICAWSTCWAFGDYSHDSGMPLHGHCGGTSPISQRCYTTGLFLFEPSYHFFLLNTVSKDPILLLQLLLFLASFLRIPLEHAICSQSLLF